jgi:16S rRNA (adenine1518-N6/adenine1519-N6)-dimethyltransferase
MYQKDFADRMVAKPGTKTYGRLSVGVYYKTHCRILERVPRSCFFPHPQVDACIVELVPREKPPFFVCDESFFSEVTKQLFMHRRKKIGTTVAASFKVKNDVPFAEKRVEQLSPADIGILADFLFETLM